MGAAALLAMSSSAFGQTLANGSFETALGGTISPNYSTELDVGGASTDLIESAVVANWTVAPNAGKAGSVRVDTAGVGLMPDGLRGVMLAGGATATSDTFEANGGTTYTLTFASFHGSSMGSEDFGVAVNDVDTPANLLSVTNLTEPLDNDWTNHSYNFTTGSAQATYKLEVVFSSPGRDIVIDNAEITAVPEPGTALLGGMLACLAMFRRRR